jgi:hypothetical protein
VKGYQTRSLSASRSKAFGSIEPTGKHVDTREVLTFRLAGGKVGEIASVWEELEFLQQLGVFPALTQATS